MEELKIRLRRAMNSNNISQIELSEKTGIPKSSINQYLSGYAKPKDDRIFLLSKALGVTESWLIGYDEDEDEDHYYTNPETRRLAQEIYQNPDLRILFDASRNLEPDDIQAIANMIKQFKGISED